LSVHLGAVTLRFAPAALADVWNTLGQALLVLDRGEREPVPLPTSRTRGTA
jgi:hypothetical protein